MLPLVLGRTATAILIVLFTFGVATADDPPKPQDAPPPVPEVPEAPALPDAPAEPPPAATPPATTPPVTTPPVATGPTIVNGRVVDVLGRPVSNARVYVIPRMGKPHTTKTSKDGRYSVNVQTLGTHGVVIAIDRAHVFRTVLVQQGVTNVLDIDVELDTEGGEVIKIEDKKRPMPKVKAKPTKDVRLSLPYSEEAVERDAWARAWLLLDVDEQGGVTRLKLLKAPGFDLDRICIEEAFRLRFDPAKDDAGRPMKTYMLWTMEWPSWGWLIQGNGTAVRRPADSNEVHTNAQNYRANGLARANWARPSAAATAFEPALDRVPCAGSGPLNLDKRNRAYRDCSQPDLSMTESLPWITRETVETAVAELKNPSLLLLEEKNFDHGSPWPGYIGAGVSAALAVTTVYGYYQWNVWQGRAESEAFKATVEPKRYAEVTGSRDRWGKRALGLTAVTILTGGATLLLWNRNMKRSSFSVQPTVNPKSESSTGLNGATAVFTTSF
jgi:hypothetical protein